MTSGSPRSSATLRASLRTSVTSLPELSSATPRRACTSGPKRVSETIQAPFTTGSMRMASLGQTRRHSSQPSQAMGSIE